MVDWLAFTVTADGWFNCGLVWEKRRGVCISARVFVSVCTCASERTWGGDSRYLRPTDRHLALHQPSTARPYGMLRNVTSWHRQRTLCVCVCWGCVFMYVCAKHQAPLCGSACTVRARRERELMKIVSNIRLLLCGYSSFSFFIIVRSHKRQPTPINRPTNPNNRTNTLSLPKVSTDGNERLH